MRAPPPTAEQRYRSACTSLNHAHACYSIWLGVEGEGRHLDALNLAPHYHRHVGEAAKRSLVVTLWSLYDQDRKALTVESIIEQLPRGILRDRLNERRKIATDGLRGARHLRHNLFAHRNARHSFSEVYRQAQLTPEDLRVGLARTLELLSDVAAAQGWPHPVIDPFVEPQMQDFLRWAAVGYAEPDQ